MSIILNKISEKIRPSHQFELCDMLGQSMAKKKSEKVKVNTVYKQKVNKIKLMNLEKSTEKKLKINSR